MNRRQRRDVRFRRNRSNVRARGMSRRRFMGTVAAGVGAMAVGASGVVSAGNPNITEEYITGNLKNLNVFPTGIPSTDVYNVQWAVDNVTPGGTVRLHSHGVGEDYNTERAFNFGMSQVQVTRSCTVEGVGQLNTVIKGGQYAIQVTSKCTGAPPNPMCSAPPKKVIIQNIHFKEFNTTGIRLHKYEEVHVLNNAFTDAIIAKSSVSQGNSMFCVAIVAPTFPVGSGWTGNIGKTIVQGNYFNAFPDGEDIYNEPPYEDVANCCGIFLADINDGVQGVPGFIIPDQPKSHIHLLDNEIYNCGQTGIGIFGCPGIRTLEIAGNTIAHDTKWGEEHDEQYKFGAYSHGWSPWMKTATTEATTEIQNNMAMGIYATGFRVGTDPNVTLPILNQGHPYFDRLLPAPDPYEPPILTKGCIYGNTISSPTRGIVLANAVGMHVFNNTINMSGGDGGIVLTGDHYCGYDPDDLPYFIWPPIPQTPPAPPLVGWQSGHPYDVNPEYYLPTQNNHICDNTGSITIITGLPNPDGDPEAPIESECQC